MRVGTRDIERASPLMKVLSKITAAESPYARSVQSGVQDLYRQVAQKSG